MERFWAKVEKTDDCWQWTACRNRDGYGQFRIDRRTREAHRLAYEWLVGPIPDDLQIDHLCRNRACVNPAHMELVTSRENSMRGESLAAQNARKICCVHGHPFDHANTYIDPRGHRGCRACNRAAVARYQARKEARP